MKSVDLRFYLDPATDEPHIYDHGVSEYEVEEVLANPGEERAGRGTSRIMIGATEAGRLLRVIYAPDPNRRSALHEAAPPLQTARVPVRYNESRRQRQ